jgi:hypothetical protein
MLYFGIAWAGVYSFNNSAAVPAEIFSFGFVIQCEFANHVNIAPQLFHSSARMLMRVCNDGGDDLSTFFINRAARKLCAPNMLLREPPLPRQAKSARNRFAARVARLTADLISEVNRFRW